MCARSDFDNDFGVSFACFVYTVVNTGNLLRLCNSTGMKSNQEMQDNIHET